MSRNGVVRANRQIIEAELIKRGWSVEHLAFESATDRANLDSIIYKSQPCFRSTLKKVAEALEIQDVNEIILTHNPSSDTPFGPTIQPVPSEFSVSLIVTGRFFTNAQAQFIRGIPEALTQYMQSSGIDGHCRSYSLSTKILLAVIHCRRSDQSPIWAFETFDDDEQPRFLAWIQQPNIQYCVTADTWATVERAYAACMPYSGGFREQYGNYSDSGEGHPDPDKLLAELKIVLPAPPSWSSLTELGTPPNCIRPATDDV